MRVSENDLNSDLVYIRSLQPAWIRIHQPTATAIFHAQRAAPNARIMLRSWDIDDHNGDRKREMYADPVGAASLHMGMWEIKLIELENELRANGMSYDKTKWFLGLVNEPDPAYVSQVVTYSLESMRIAVTHGYYLGVVVSSVGTFSKPSENPHGWALCKPLEKPINDGGHILIAHEYWQPEGPNYGEDGGNLAWRHKHIPLNVPILIGESGANGYIYGRYSANDDSGWQKTVKDPAIYAAQVKEYIEGCDSRVQGVCLYMTDYHSDQWQSFDTQPAMHRLLAVKDARPQVPSPFGIKQTTHLPSIESGKTEQVMSDNWQRSRAFVRKWEGDYSDTPEDHGNWTGGRKGVGELKGTKYGISAGSYPHLDIRNLTMQQADDIYFRDYWQASGANKLPWPYCLLVFDTAALHGVGASLEWQAEVGENANAFAAKRLRVYTGADNWHYFGAGWVNRVADLLEVASQP